MVKSALLWENFALYASLLAIILGLLMVGDSPTLATEKRVAEGVVESPGGAL